AATIYPADVSGVAPANLTAPVLTGSATVGATLTVSNGTWSGSDITYSYKWFADDVEIGGQTTNQLTLVSGNIGEVIHAEVTATNTSGSDSEISNDSAAVVDGTTGMTDVT